MQMCYNINSFWNFHGQQNIVCENIGLLNAARSGASSVQTIASRAWPVVRRILTGRERGGQRTASRGRTALYFRRGRTSLCTGASAGNRRPVPRTRGFCSLPRGALRRRRSFTARRAGGAAGVFASPAWAAGPLCTPGRKGAPDGAGSAVAAMAGFARRSLFPARGARRAHAPEATLCTVPSSPLQIAGFLAKNP